MQDDPEKFLRNYNEYDGIKPAAALREGFFQILQDEEQLAKEPVVIIQTGLRLVNAKINQLLGRNNKLTRGDLVFPEVRFIATCPEYPQWAGYFASDTNEIGVITDNIKDDPVSQTKVFIHEYIHFLSHNGHDEGEQVDENSPIAQNNNIGFRRFFGLDIRAGREGRVTTDYFLAFNEAATEQLAIDILPNVHETYGEYRGLLNQVIDDAVTRGLGAENEGVFQAWSRDQIKDYIYLCFFKGDLGGFTTLLKNTYKEYNISEQQFGLMTHRDDLPSVIELTVSAPGSPPPSPADVAMLVRKRLDSKRPDDYISDVIWPEPGGGDSDSQIKYGTEYDTHVRKYAIAYSRSETIDGVQYDVDSQGYIIYHDEDASLRLDDIRDELDDLLDKKVDATAIAERMDILLFDTYRMSMLSDGFRDFYIYKHSKIDSL